MSGNRSSLILGLFILAGLASLGWLLGDGLIRFKELDRTVSVKGLAEREVPADIALWPIQFSHAENDLTVLYDGLEQDAGAIRRFLVEQGFGPGEITVGVPLITDKVAQSYGGGGQVPLRYSATQAVTVYSRDIDRVRTAMRELVTLGKQGIALTGNAYDSRTQYLFTGLNDIKPAMVEEATRKAREVGEKFAADSGSRLGRIRTARQGQFSISDRDANNPHIKRIRVVTTVEYYLAD